MYLLIMTRKDETETKTKLLAVWPQHLRLGNFLIVRATRLNDTHGYATTLWSLEIFVVSKFQ